MNICAGNRIDLFMDALAARRPSPGGGAAAALAGALGTALIIKVANFTVGSKKYKRYERQARAAAKKAGRIGEKLEELIKKDAETYKEYSRTKSGVAMRKATSCVAAIAVLSRDALKLRAALKRIGNKNLEGDLYAAGLLLNASAKAADNLVKLNKKYLKLSLRRPKFRPEAI